MTGLEVSVAGPAGPLAATLELPEGVGPFPGVVLVSGSGPLDRNSDYKKMRFGVSRELAAALREAGMASLRFDKRGVGTSDLDWRTAGLEDNADDTAAAVETLRARPEVRNDQVLLVGHSEGAILAGMVAARGIPLAGVGLLSGTARTGRDVLRWQADAIIPTLPRPVRLILRLLRIDVAGKLTRTHDKIARTTEDVTRIGGRRVNAKWLREFLQHDAAEDLRRIDVPVLAVTGSKDLQTPPADVPQIAAILGSRAETHVVPDVTHILRHQNAAPSLRLYKQEVHQPLDPHVVHLVVDWATRITAHVRTTAADAR